MLAGDDRNHRAEDFFLRDAHFGIDVGEHGRFHEPAVFELALVQTVAAALHLRPFGFADLHVVEIGLELGLVDGRAHFDGLIQAVSDFQAPRPFDIALHEFAVDALLHQNAAGGGATLAGGAEAAPESAFNGQVEIGVVEHDHRVLAAQFERAMLEALGGGGTYDAADGARAGQRNGPDIGMLGERSANVRAGLR